MGDGAEHGKRASAWRPPAGKAAAGLAGRGRGAAATPRVRNGSRRGAADARSNRAGDPTDHGIELIAIDHIAVWLRSRWSRITSKLVPQPIGSDFPEDFDIATAAELLFDVCQKREDWQIRIVPEQSFEGFPGFWLWFIHPRYSRGSADIGWAGRPAGLPDMCIPASFKHDLARSPDKAADQNSAVCRETTHGRSVSLKCTTTWPPPLAVGGI